MKMIVAAISLLAAAGAQAQLIEPSAPRLAAEATTRYGPLADGFQRYQPLYGRNETANPNDRQFSGFRTDPRLLLGYSVNRYFAIETGYAHLVEEGFHKIEPGPVEDAVSAGALGVKSFTGHVGAKLTLPLNERLNAYGKLGVARTVLGKDDPLLAQGAVPTIGGKDRETGRNGGFGALGAEYKLNEKATIKGEVRKNRSADKLGAPSNATGLRGSVGIGF